MSTPTKAELQEILAEQKAKTKALGDWRDNLDTEALAYDRILKALLPLKRSGYYRYDNPGDKVDAVAAQRVLRAVAERLGIEL